jgi:hypothetical protein
MKRKSLVRLCLAVGLFGSLVVLLGIELPSVVAAAVTRLKKPDARVRPLPRLPALTPDQQRGFMTRILPMLGSGQTQRQMAKELGVPGIAGKRLDSGRNVRAPERFRTELDAQVTGDYYGWLGFQNEPSIAVSPIDADVVVAFTHNTFNFSGLSNACSIYLSFDGGLDFFYYTDVPHEVTDRDGDGALDTHFCSDPVIRASPYAGTAANLNHLFYLTYMDINRGDANDPPPAVLTSKIRLQRRFVWDLGSTFTTTALDANPVGFLDKNWVDVHTFDVFDGSLDAFGTVYVTSTVFFNDGSCGIAFNRSFNFGTTWSFGTGAVLIATPPGNTCAAPFLVQGSRPIGGPGNKMMVCFYDSASDGWSPGSSSSTSGKFFIDCAASPDQGTSFPVFVSTSPPISYEAPFWLGPNASLHRWWGSMFPSLAIDHLGNGHVAYTLDPTPLKADAESGNVVYQKSTLTATNPLYALWGGKVTLGSGSMAQGWASVIAQKVNKQKAPIIWLAYMDHQGSAALGTGAKNLIYDVRYRKSITGGPAFAGSVLVTDQSSLSDYVFIGDYIDGAANSRRYHVIWTDRADKTSIFDYEDDVFADRY